MTAAREREIGRRMTRASPRRLGPLLLTVCIGLCVFPAPASAKVYECRDPTGDRVYTDDPQSLLNCRALAIESEPPPPKPTIPSEQAPPVKEPPGKASEQTAPAVQSPPFDPALSRSEPASPTDPEYAPPPHVVAPQTQTCVKDINRLNPFGSAPCQPSPGPPPTSVPYEDYYR